jgi:hypothetical protein
MDEPQILSFLNRQELLEKACPANVTRLMMREPPPRAEVGNASH